MPSTCFEHNVLIIRRSELYYTSSGIFTPIGGRLVQNLFHNKFYFMPSTCFEHNVLIIRRSELYYTSSGIITPTGGRLVHEMATCRSDDTRGCVMQF